MRSLSNVMGVDDAPFERSHRGDVPMVGTICTRARLDGVVTSRVRRDGRNATRAIAEMLGASPFREHVQAIALNGIAVAGFNVVDLEALHAGSGLPVIAIARKAPDLVAIERALRTRVPGGARKWRLIEQAGAMEPLEGVWVQRVGASRAEVSAMLRATRAQGLLPEPLRLAHLIAGAIGRGTSKGGA